MAHTAEHIWRYGDIDVMYSPDLNGGGSEFACFLVASIKNYFGAERRFGTVFEWCAGPGFIGFALLGEDVCDSLCLADINPVAIDCVHRTIKVNKLQDRVRGYVSDNLISVPQRERFDLVVGNPPNFYAVNPVHPARAVLSGRWDLLGQDGGWRSHAGFYSQIAPFLNPGAFVLVQEVEPHSREVFCHGSGTIPWDIRPENQATLFPEMIRRGGLTHVGDFEIRHSGWPDIKSWMQVSQKPV